MKVLHINCNYMYSKLHQSLIESLESIGVNSEVFVPLFDSADCSRLQPNENVKLSFCFNRADRFLYHYKQRKIYKSIINSYSLKDFSCVHAYTLFTDGNVARKIFLNEGIPYVVAIRNTDVNIFLKYLPHLRKTGLRILRDASAIFFLSETYRQQVINKYVPPEWREIINKKSFIVPNGIDEFWHINKNKTRDYGEIAYRIIEKNIKLLYAGVIDKNKNVLLADSARKVLESEGWKVQYDIVGRVEDYREYNKVKNRVNYFEAVPKEELLNFYRTHDIFVMPSHTESFGLVYAEAMSQGLPVIYTRGQGFDGQFAEGAVGYATSDMDPKELASNIKKICERYEEISKTALELSDAFSWNTICQKYKEIYKRVSLSPCDGSKDME